MAQVHGNQCEATQQKSQKQRETVCVVETRDEHEEEQHPKSQSRPRRQNVESASLQCQRQGIGALSPSYPGRHLLADEAFHEGGALKRYGDRSDELLSDRL